MLMDSTNAWKIMCQSQVHRSILHVHRWTLHVRRRRVHPHAQRLHPPHQPPDLVRPRAERNLHRTKLLAPIRVASRYLQRIRVSLRLYGWLDRCQLFLELSQTIRY